MPFSISEITNSFNQSITNNETYFSLVSNPIYISFLIVSIILLIISVFYSNESFLYSLFKIGLYSFIAIIIMVVVHDSALKIKYTRHEHDDLSNTIATGAGERLDIEPNSEEYSKINMQNNNNNNNNNININNNGNNVNNNKEIYVSDLIDDTGGWTLP